MNNDSKIVISVEEYKELVNVSVKYKILVDSMFTQARLSFDNDLRIEEESTRQLIKAFENKKYDETLKRLLKQKEGK